MPALERYASSTMTPHRVGVERDVVVAEQQERRALDGGRARRWPRPRIRRSPASRRTKASGQRRRDPGGRVRRSTRCRARGPRAPGSPGRRARPARASSHGPGSLVTTHRDDRWRAASGATNSSRSESTGSSPPTSDSSATTGAGGGSTPAGGRSRPGPELGSGVSMRPGEDSGRHPCATDHECLQ